MASRSGVAPVRLLAGAAIAGCGSHSDGAVTRLNAPAAAPRKPRREKSGVPGSGWLASAGCSWTGLGPAWASGPSCCSDMGAPLDGRTAAGSTLAGRLRFGVTQAVRDDALELAPHLGP